MHHVCVSSSGIKIAPAQVAAHPTLVKIQRRSVSDTSATAAAAQQAAEQAAALNADSGNAQGYGMASKVGVGRLLCRRVQSAGFRPLVHEHETLKYAMQ